MAIRVRKSTGNVFRDLGFSAAEAENLRARSLLMIKIDKLIAARGWTQSAAAKALGVSQPRISDLVRGKVDKFSTDMLIEMLGRAGVEVTITTRSRRSGHSRDSRSHEAHLPPRQARGGRQRPSLRTSPGSRSARRP